MKRQYSQQDRELFHAFPEAEGSEAVRYDLSCCWRENQQTLNSEQGRLLFTQERCYFQPLREDGLKVTISYADIKSIKSTGGFIPGIIITLQSSDAPIYLTNFLDRHWPQTLLLHFWKGTPFALPAQSGLGAPVRMYSGGGALPRSISIDPSVLMREGSSDAEPPRAFSSSLASHEEAHQGAGEGAEGEGGMADSVHSTASSHSASRTQSNAEAVDFSTTRCPRCMHDFGTVEMQQMHYLTDIEGCMANLATDEDKPVEPQPPPSSKTGLFGTARYSPGFSFGGASAAPKFTFGAKAPTPTSTTAPFTFGAKAPTSTAAPFTFGASSASASASSSSATASPLQPPPFSFGPATPFSPGSKLQFGKKHNEGAWESCGGNPKGEAHPSPDDPKACTDACRDCGANTHWTCCGSTFKASMVCKPAFSFAAPTSFSIASPTGTQPPSSVLASSSEDSSVGQDIPSWATQGGGSSIISNSISNSAAGGFSFPAYSSFAGVCPHFMAGYCRSGSSCKLSHGSPTDQGASYSALLRNFSSVSQPSDHGGDRGEHEGGEEEQEEQEEEEEEEYDDYGERQSRGRRHRRGAGGKVLCFNTRVASAKFVERRSIERGDKIILHQGVLSAALEVESTFPWPLALRVSNKAGGGEEVRALHAGVLDFSCEEEYAVLPDWMMAQLHVKDGDEVEVRAVNIPKGTFCQLQPQTRRWQDIPTDKRQGILEFRLRDFQTLTEGSEVNIHHEGQTYPFRVLQCRPAPAISIIDCDLATDIVNPPDDLGNEEQTGEVDKIVYLGQTNVAASVAASGTQPGALTYTQFTLRAPRGMETLPSPLRIAIAAKTGEPDLYVSALRPPTQDCYDLCAQGEGTASIVLREGAIGWHPTVIRFSVASVGEASEFTVSATSLVEAAAAAAAGAVEEGGAEEAKAPEEPVAPLNPDEEQCKNCRKYIAKTKMVMHERHCARHMARCEHPGCGALMTHKAKPKHDLVFHTELQCPCCPFKATQVALHSHQLHECTGRLVMCENPWCRMLLVASEIAEHMEACWMRTTICPLCFQDVRWRDMEGHFIMTHAVDPSRLDFSDLMNIDRDNLPFLQ